MAVGFVRLNEDYNATGKTLKFSIKSDTKENGGNDQIRVYLEADSGSNSAFPEYQTLGTEGIEIFTNDGTWQDVEIDVDVAFGFSGSGISAANIRSIGFALLDANGLSPSGFGDQVIDIDEIRFVSSDLSYICENGTPATGEDATTAGVSNCQACNQGYEVVGNLGEAGSTCVFSTCIAPWAEQALLLMWCMVMQLVRTAVVDLGGRERLWPSQQRHGCFAYLY